MTINNVQIKQLKRMTRNKVQRKQLKRNCKLLGQGFIKKTIAKTRPRIY